MGLSICRSKVKLQCSGLFIKSGTRLKRSGNYWARSEKLHLAEAQFELGCKQIRLISNRAEWIIVNNNRLTK
jgi:hypothetical protein